MANGTIALPSSVIPTLQAMGNLWASLVKELNKKTTITIKTKIDPDQWWFWTPEWQVGERQADEDIRLGNYKTFDNVNDLIKDLHRRRFFSVAGCYSKKGRSPAKISSSKPSLSKPSR